MNADAYAWHVDSPHLTQYRLVARREVPFLDSLQELVETTEIHQTLPIVVAISLRIFTLLLNGCIHRHLLFVCDWPANT